MLAAIAGILDFSFIQTVAAEHRPVRSPSRSSPRSSSAAPASPAARARSIGTIGGALLLAELQQGLALLSPGPHVQQLFLGVVTIGAVALDLALTHVRKQQGGMSAAPRPAGIRIRERLHKRYGSTVALDGIDLDIRPGEVLGIAGPNGAGKSTLVRIIAGEERPDAATLTVDGRPWSPIVDWHAVAVVHQEPQLFPNLTVAENVLVGREGTRTGWPRLGARRRRRDGGARHRAVSPTGSSATARSPPSSAPRSPGRSPATRASSCSTSPTRR